MLDIAASTETIKKRARDSATLASSLGCGNRAPPGQLSLRPASETTNALAQIARGDLSAPRFALSLSLLYSSLLISSSSWRVQCVCQHARLKRVRQTQLGKRRDGRICLLAPPDHSRLEANERWSNSAPLFCASEPRRRRERRLSEKKLEELDARAQAALDCARCEI